MSFKARTWGWRFRLREMAGRNWLVIPCPDVFAVIPSGRVVPVRLELDETVP